MTPVLCLHGEHRLKEGALNLRKTEAKPGPDLRHVGMPVGLRRTERLGPRRTPAVPLLRVQGGLQGLEDRTRGARPGPFK